MPPRFRKDSFAFTPGNEVPEHIDEYASEEGRDRSKWYLVGYDTFEREPYPLASDIDAREVAIMLKNARQRQLELTQLSSSDSQGLTNLQDRVYIIPPEKV